MSLAGSVGTVFSVAFLWWLMSDWLQRDDGGFGLIFGFTGIGFVLGGLWIVLLKEPPDPTQSTKWVIKDRFRDAWNVFLHDARFRRLAIVAMCFCPLMLLFPHYQALGRRGADIQSSASDLMVWVIVQNVAVGVYSVIAGYLADRWGNRLVVRFEMFIGALAPLVALNLASGSTGDQPQWFWLTFFLIGVAPVALRSFLNFTLELADTVDHPRYVSTMNVCLAVPFLASPLLGYLVDLIGFTPVFVGSSAVIATGFLLTFRLPEPRHDG